MERLVLAWHLREVWNCRCRWRYMVFSYYWNDFCSYLVKFYMQVIILLIVTSCNSKSWYRFQRVCVCVCVNKPNSGSWGISSSMNHHISKYFGGSLYICLYVPLSRHNLINMVALQPFKMWHQSWCYPVICDFMLLAFSMLRKFGRLMALKLLCNKHCLISLTTKHNVSQHFVLHLCLCMLCRYIRF